MFMKCAESFSTLLKFLFPLYVLVIVAFPVYQGRTQHIHFKIMGEKKLNSAFLTANILLFFKQIE